MSLLCTKRLISVPRNPFLQELPPCGYFSDTQRVPQKLAFILFLSRKPLVMSTHYLSLVVLIFSSCLAISPDDTCITPITSRVVDSVNPYGFVANISIFVHLSVLTNAHFSAPVYRIPKTFRWFECPTSNL